MDGKTITATAVAALALILAGCGSVSTLAVGRQIATTPHCTEFFFSVYFADGSDELTKPARAVIHDAGVHAKGCQVASVEVIGLSDSRGLSDANLALSHSRADRVAAALAESGLAAPTFKLSAVGEAGAIADDGGARPMRRRVNVVIRFDR